MRKASSGALVVEPQRSPRRDAAIPKKERAQLGAHYTPHLLARKVTANALQPLMAWPEAMQCPECVPSVALTNLLVIDPACGDGAFLSAAADQLAAILFSVYIDEGIDRTLEEARAIIVQECIVGIDKDPGAVEAARQALPGAEIECADALLDWDFDTAGRPCAFVGNPPFLGGCKISGSLGVAYQKRLLAEYPHTNGNADLCTFFFLLAADTLYRGRSKGTVSFIATNTISQGDTREAGLGWLLQNFGMMIYRAERDMPWPGEATVMVSIVHMANNRLAWKLWPENAMEQAIHWPGAWPDEPVRLDAPVPLRRLPPKPDAKRMQQEMLFA